jgi:hypothetical protein
MIDYVLERFCRRNRGHYQQAGMLDVHINSITRLNSQKHLHILNEDKRINYCTMLGDR